MEISEIILNALNKSNSHIEVFDDLRRIDFAIALELKQQKYYKTYESLGAQLKIVELIAKRYVLGTLLDDKKLRINALQNLRKLGETLPGFLKSFRKAWEEHKQEDENCTNEDCQHAN